MHKNKNKVSKNQITVYFLVTASFVLGYFCHAILSNYNFDHGEQALIDLLPPTEQAQSITSDANEAISGIGGVGGTGHKYAIVNAGPHKTGSTAIQDLLLDYDNHLAGDNYAIPHNIPGVHKKEKHLANVALVLSGQDTGNNHETWMRFQYFLRKANVMNENILLAAETFDDIAVDVPKLAAQIKPWDISIVVLTLRRAYEWLPSMYFETQRYTTEPFPTFQQWMERWGLNSSESRHNIQASSVVRRYSDHFDEVVVMDYHDPTPLKVQFFCNAIPGTSVACERAKNEPVKRANTGSTSSLEYLRLVIAARRQGFLNAKKAADEEAACDTEHCKFFPGRILNKFLRDVADKARYHQEKVLNKKLLDFPHNCPQNLMDVILDISVAEARELAPFMNRSEQEGEEAVRKGFKESLEKVKSKICSIDTSEILKDEEWITFFRDVKI